MENIDARLSAFLSRCDALAPRLKLTRSTLSTKLFMDGKRLSALAEGRSDVGIGRLAKAERELAALEGLAPHKRSAA
jgi:hypothetical protein